jgi:hypothetical protein
LQVLQEISVARYTCFGSKPGICALCVIVSKDVFAKNADGLIVGGLTGKTYWNYLEVVFLWVTEESRDYERFYFAKKLPKES